MRFRIIGLILVFALGTSGCASSQVARKLRVVTDTWSVVQLSDSNEFVVVAKGGNDLKRALETMGCDKAPCTVGRLGNVYSVITAPEQSSNPRDR
jgi:hypothetical protein